MQTQNTPMTIETVHGLRETVVFETFVVGPGDLSGESPNRSAIDPSTATSNQTEPGRPEQKG